MNRKDELQQKINDVLKSRKIDSNFLDSKTIEELLFEIGNYHQELEYQNLELKRIGEELEESKKRYFELFEEAPLAYVVIDSSRAIHFTNKVFRKMIGCSVKDVENNSIDKYIHPDSQDAFYLHIRDLLNNKFNHDAQILIRGKEKEIPVKLEINLMSEGNITLIRIAFIDITHEKTVESALKYAKEQAEMASNAKSRFLANMSHEIRTPMNVILGYLELLKYSKLSDDQHEHISRAKVAGDILLNLINEILDLAKIESGKLELDYENFDIKNIVDFLTSVFEPQFKEKGLDFIIQIEEGFSGTLLGDIGRIKQVWMNLLSNAIKFTDKGSVRVEVSKISDDKETIEVLFRVKDTGIGISEEYKPHVFSSFTQQDASTTRKYGGTGLGLAITKHLVEIMGGDIWFQSKVSEGTEFNFKLPFKKVVLHKGSEVVQAKNTQKMNKGDSGRNPRILIVEDNELNTIIVSKMLKSRGYGCDIVDDGIKAVKVCQKGEYDIVLMDIQMPIMDGYEATNEIRKNRDIVRQPKIIAMTANAMKGEREKVMQFGMDDYISKPIDFEKMFEIIERYS